MSDDVIYTVFKLGPNQGCKKLVSVVSRIPDKLLMIRQMTYKIRTKTKRHRVRVDTIGRLVIKTISQSSISQLLIIKVN